MEVLRRISFWIYTLLGITLFFATLFSVLALCSVPTNAYAHAGSGSLRIGVPVKYGSYETNWMEFDNKFAYCIQPSRTTPSNGQYAWSSSTGALQQDAFRNYMYYGYGGPGFSPSDPAWPTLNYQGKPMTEDDYYACTHVLLSDAFASNGEETLTGLEGSERYWYAWQVLGFGVNVGREDNNENAIGWILKTRTLPGNWADLSMQAGSSTWNWQERLQYSPSFTLLADNEQASVSFPLPPEITLHNVTTGATLKGATAHIAAGETFYFTAPPSVKGVWDSSALTVSGLRDFTPVRIFTGGQTQECATWKEGMEGGTKTVSFSLRWLGFGDIDVLKTIESDNELTPSLHGVTFMLTNVATKEQVVIETDAHGKATTVGLDKNAFPYGRLVEGAWTLEEVAGTPEGYSPMKPITISVSAGQSPLRLVVENKKLFGVVRIIKVDAESKEPILLGGAQGAAFRLFRLDPITQAYDPIEWHVPYPTPTVLHEAETASDGTLMFPEPLQQGTYKLVETRSPLGYVMETPLERVFEVNNTHNWEEPLEITIENTLKKGAVSLLKSDDTTGSALEGAVYRITAAEDIVTPDGLRHFAEGDTVEEIMTSPDGAKTSQDLFFGTYRIKEISTPTGFAIDPQEYHVSLNAEKSNETFVRESLEVTDSPTSIIIEKKGRDSGRLLEGARFRIRQQPSDENGSGDILDTERTTDSAGRVSLSYLAPGTYFVQEIQAPQGYTLNNVVQSFTVNRNGLIDGAEAKKLVFENEPETIKLANTQDIASGMIAPIASIVFLGTLMSCVIAIRTTKRRFRRKTRGR